MVADVPFWLCGGHLMDWGPAADAGDRLNKMPNITMTAQTSQTTAATIITNNITSGLSELDDTSLIFTTNLH